MKRLLATAALLPLSLAALVPAATAQRAPKAPRPELTRAEAAALANLPTQLPRHTRPLRYRIEIVPDAANLRFAGTTRIDLEVLEPTSTLTLNAADLKVDRATLTTGGGAPRPATLITPNAEAQTVTFAFGAPLAPGRHSVEIAYAGVVNTQAAGLFALDYDTPAGAKKRALFTQFEAPDARRMFPGFDEPRFRTPYELSVVVPADQMAIGNMPAARTEPQAGGVKRVTFAPTPSMPSYLLFLATGEFDRIAGPADGAEMGIVTKRGDAEKGRYALRNAQQLHPYFNSYFGQRYPLPKLDNVAGPGSSQFFGAMENWGAIFSFESILLDDPAITTDAQRQRIYEVQAHEMAHQWFGNLVTMGWWSELWLNEGFASWMATKATDRFHPEWGALLSRVGGREAAMALDSVATTHPVIQPVETVEQTSQAFDAITYQKGEAVITMLEAYVGEDAWRRGVRDYMRTYRYGNTVSDMLWGKVERAARRPITAIAHDFTLQPGVPLIRVGEARCEGGRTAVRLTQAEFSRDRPNKAPLRWRVPVIASAGGEAARTLVQGGAASLDVPGCGALVVNSGQTGYFRTLYPQPMLDRLQAGYASLKPMDQIGLLSDSWSLGLAGYQSSAEALDFVDAVPADAAPQLWERAAGVLASAHALHEADPAGRARVAAYTSAKLGPVLGRLGYAPRAGEASTQAVLRSTLISTLGAVGDRAVVAEANRRFQTSLSDPASLAGPLRTAYLSVVAQNADARTWDQLRTQARAERSPLVRQSLYRLLGATRDQALARRTLALALTAEPGATNSSAMIGAVASRHPELAFDFALANRAAVEALVDTSSRSRFFPQLAGGSADPATVAKVRAYADRYLSPTSRRPADIAVAAIEDRVRVRRERLPAIAAWFAAKAGPA